MATMAQILDKNGDPVMVTRQISRECALTNQDRLIVMEAIQDMFVQREIFFDLSGVGLLTPIIKNHD